MSHSARYERGLAKFVEMYGERTKTFLASLEGIAPDLGTYVLEFGFGDIHCRPGLSLQSREIATIAALTALGTAGPTSFFSTLPVPFLAFLLSFASAAMTSNKAIKKAPMIFLYTAIPSFNGLCRGNDSLAFAASVLLWPPPLNQRAHDDFVSWEGEKSGR